VPTEADVVAALLRRCCRAVTVDHRGVCRIAGTHVYGSEAPGITPWETSLRAQRLARRLPRFLHDFPEIWKERVWELETGLNYFEKFDTRGKSLSELGDLLIDARTFNRRAWEIHFEVMYPLLTNYLGFYGMCGEYGIDPAQIAKFLQGYSTKMMECDRLLWQLTNEARATPAVASVFAKATAGEILLELKRAGSAAPAWLASFEAMLGKYGMRTEGIADPTLAPWNEDPTPALGTVKTFLEKGNDFDFDASARALIAERDEAIEATHRKLSRSEREAFDQGLAACQHANFSWWNEDHNYYIDLPATTPVRIACLAIGRELGLDDPTDTLFSFHRELVDVCKGRRNLAEMRGLLLDRRDYYNEWLRRRPSMPKVLGTVPDAVVDPVMIEIFGIHRHFLAAVNAGNATPRELRGVAASSGTARGPARVLHDASQLHSIQIGDVLICEGTTPAWTPAFTKIAACVCDGGGTLAHASIISREYRVPCVVGVGVGTSVIRDGDMVEVNGNIGTVSAYAPLPS
jgi:pyruvate,water dikinase